MEAGDTESSAVEDSDVIEIIPSEDYDIGKAKLRLSLLWLLHRSYEDQIPREFQDPFYENSDGVCLLKPQLVLKLASGEIYFLAYSNLFPEVGSLHNFSTLIQTLSRRGIYVTDYDGHAVTESTLLQTAPFKVKSHLSLMDALMKCYTHKLVSIEKVVQAVRSLVNFDTCKELPNSVENALLFWVNKICLYVQDFLRKEYRSQHDEPKSDPLGRTVPSIPLLSSLRDIGEGCALAVLISFYCPDQLRLQDIVLKSSISIADSLFNLRLIRNFCSRHMFSSKCFHFTYEDLLYSDDLIFPNIYVYLADLFNKFENNKYTKSKGAPPEVKNETYDLSVDRMSASQPVSKVPISNATKKSFQNFEYTAISQEPFSPVSTPPPRQPLLQKRYQQNIADRDGTENLQYSVSGESQKVKVRPAWQESSDLLRHSGDGDTSVANYNHRGSEVDHWAVPQSSTPEPLMPARLKPAKEKSSNHSKSVERGDQMEGSKPRRSSINVRQSHDEGFVQNPLGDHDVSREESSLQQLFKRNSLTSEQSSTFPRSRHSSGASNPEDSQRPFVIGQSFTLPDRPSTSNSARLEGLPVVQSGNSDEIELRRCVSREGSIASNRSSGDFSDHESQKIHRDHKAKETKESKDSFILSDQVESGDFNQVTKPLIISHPIEEEILDKTKTTNFAQIKKMRDMSGPLTSLVYMQRGQELDSPNKLSPKDSFHKKDDEKSDKKTGFAPHQTTWQQQRRPGSTVISVSQESSPENQSQSVSDQMNIRMKLEERRKQIEQKKHELERHQTKIRQQVGKEALLHVVASQNTLDKNGQIPPGIPPNIRRYIRQANGSMVGGGRVGESVPEEDSSSIIDTQRSSQKPFSREEIQRTIENARKKWLNEADAVKKNEPYEADTNECSIPRSSESPVVEPIRQAPLHHEPVPVKPEPVSIRQEPVHQELGPVRPEPRYHESVRREPVPIRQEPHREPVPMRQEPIQQEAAVIRPQPVVAVQPGFREDHSRSHVSPERRDHRRDRSSSGEREENYGNYNSSLDRLNRSLTDLQGEIMKLSLQQQQIKSQGLEKTHPKQIGMVPSVSAAGVVHNQHGQQFVLHSPTPPAQPYISPVISPYPTHTPHSVGPHQHLPNTFTTSIGQPIPTATPFSGLPGHPKPDIAGIHPSMANAVITSTAGGILSLHGTHARTQEEPIPSGYAPHPHAVSSSGYVPYSSTNNNITGETEWQSPIGSPRNRGIRPTHMESPSSSPPRQPPPHSSPPRQPPPHGSPPRQPLLHGSPPRQPLLHGSPPRQPTPHGSPPRQPPPHGSPPRQPPPHTSPQHQPSKLISATKPHVIEEAVPESDDSTEIADEQTTATGNEGFFVSFGNEPPRRPKPKLMPKREKKEEKKEEEKKPTPSVTKEEHALTPRKQLSPVKFDPALYIPSDDVPAAPPVGFVVQEPEEEIPDDQITVRKNRMLKLQQKRREEQERRRQEKEEALSKKREQEQLKKEEIERRKANEKARREFILQQYKERKRKEEDEEKNGPSDRYERPSRPHKPRPKSMIVRSSKPPEACDDEVGSIHSTSSQEDLAGRGFSSPTSSSSNSRIPQYSRPGLRKAVSMNLLANQGNSSRSGFGRRPPSPVMMNLFTHQTFTGRTGFGRRPPSPDLYRFGRKSGKSTESSSDAGSTAGSDYTGPKLFVKPSSKSNRHIIINAISHCCLAGSVNTDLKNKVLEEIAKSDAKHFVILFRDAGCAFRSLYAYYPEREEAVKIHGIGPKLVTSKNIEKYYKYNSGGKSFSEVTSTKHLSVSIDAVVINGNLWKNSKSISRR
ncbi:CAMSAP [Acanthosepion pharaonis]|uniref:CAMSAP n=1 Tax=Acanthosepion pharaonis TaxID=158019 RepID=A0A812DXW2_ACAPH|nr:CAMSAP [Sepia pharaonis]